ncbi:MAG: GTP-binding protein, partial [Planctomycetaceae bacterium]|nr:GTP-binding protein [Planctomycetaceae bacterium]
MTTFAVENHRNVALVGHGATGKTTLADLILHKTGIASRAGSVDDGSSLLDIDDDEKERKSSLSSAAVHCEHQGKRITLIDAPGYPDFIGQAIGALRAVETAVIVINAHAGIEVNTRRMFGLAGNAGVGRMILINKCDTDNVDYSQLIDDIQEMFGATCVPLNVPVGISESFSGVVSTLSAAESVPDGAQADPADFNATLMDAIVEADEALMERFLEGEELSADEVSAGVSKAIAAGTLIPILCSSSRNDVGVSEFMDALATFALSPTEVSRTAKNAAGEEVTLEPEAGGPAVAQVFKTRIDPFVAKMSYLRVFSGTLKKDAQVHNVRTDKPLKIGQLFDVQGGKQEPVDQAGPGDIVAVIKVEDLATGDTISGGSDALQLPPIPFPMPMVGLAVEPKSAAG